MLAAVRLLVLVCLTLALGACGGNATTTTTRATTTTTSAAAAQRQQMEAVVNAWSRYLNANDNVGITHLFRLPAIVTQGGFVFRLKTALQLTIWHRTLPCSGHIVSISLRGHYAFAVFRLGNRGATKCDAPGQLAAARFGIVRGKIVSWMQIPVPGGHAQGPAA